VDVENRSRNGRAISHVLAAWGFALVLPILAILLGAVSRFLAMARSSDGLRHVDRAGGHRQQQKGYEPESLEDRTQHCHRDNLNQQL
jgi:hypothetical protein